MMPEATVKMLSTKDIEKEKRRLDQDFNAVLGPWSSGG
jgi:hypothetical protein